MNDYYLYAYVFGFFVTTLAFVDARHRSDWREWLASAILGAFWPVVIPALIIRKVIA